MVEDQVVSLLTNLTATGITAATSTSASKARTLFRRRRFSEELEDLATEFLEELESAIEAEHARRDTNELAGLTTDWSAIAHRLAVDAGQAGQETAREGGQLELVFDDEEEAVERLAEAIAAVNGFSLEQTPELKTALTAALTRAYREAIAAFKERVADTELAELFEAETNLELVGRLNELQNQLAQFGADIESLLSQAAKEEGFRQLTESEFARGPAPRPERCWRIGFTLADVRAGLPAERVGKSGDTPASQELFARLGERTDCIVVGGPGSGKSTLCKQVAIRWYESQSTGPVLYRESGAGGGSHFESVDSLKQAITATDAHTLVVVEDAVQPGGNAIFEVMEALSSYEQVSFLLDGLRTDVDEFDGTAPPESSVRARQADLVDSLQRYHVPRLTADDIAAVIRAFERATDRSVDREPAELRRELKARSDAEIGDMMLLSFLLPVGSGVNAATGLERNVRNRYETLDPDSDTAIRDLSRFDPELVADVGVMVTLLNASGIGVKPELVHALGVEYGHDWETHDDIAEVRAALEGWFLYASDTEATTDIQRTTHPLWSTLYLRELATEHETKQRASRRRDRSNPRVARCLTALFALFDDPDQRDQLEREFPNSGVIASIEDAPRATADEYISDLLSLGQQWPALVSLFGTTTTALYDFPEVCSEHGRWTAIEMRGHAHRLRGNASKARNEYTHVLEVAQAAGDRHAEARNHNNLGLVAEADGDVERAREQFQAGLARFRERGDRHGEATCLSNLGVVARKQGDIETARQYHERSLAIFRDVAGGHLEATCLGNLGVLAHSEGDFESAREYLRASFEIARDLRDRHGEAKSLISLGLIARNEGNFETAREYLQRSLKIERELGTRHGEAKCLGIQGLIARDKGELETARESYERSLELFRTIGDDHSEATILSGLAMVAYAEGAYDDAEAYLEQSLELLEALGDRHSMAECRGLLGVVALGRGEAAAGRAELRAALPDLREIGARLTEIRVLRHHIEAESHHGHTERVADLYEQARACIDRAEPDLGYEQDRIESIYQDLHHES